MRQLSWAGTFKKDQQVRREVLGEIGSEVALGDDGLGPKSTR